METRIEATIVAWVDKSSLTQAVKTVTDTGKKINKALRLKLEVDVAKAQANLTKLRQQLKSKDLTKQQKIILQIDTNRAQRNLTELKAKLKNVENTGSANVSRLQTKFNALWKGILASAKSMVWAAAIMWVLIWAVRWLGRLFSSSVDESIEFEKSMANIATLIDTDVESIDEMWKSLLKLSWKIPKSVWELTEALYDIRSAGILAEDAMDVLEQSARLATAGLWTTKEAANLMTGALNNFSKQWYTATEIATTFFLAVKDGKTTISELSQGFGSVSNLASNLGVDFRDLVAAATALTTGNLSASEAYTQLSGIMSAVAKQSPQSLKQAKDLRFEFSAVALETKGLAWFIADLWVKLKENGYEWAKTTEVLSKLFGRKEALVGVLSLLNSRSEKYAEILKEMASNSTAFTDAFDKQMDTTAAKIEILNNKISEQKILLWNNTSIWKVFWLKVKLVFIKLISDFSAALKIIWVEWNELWAEIKRWAHNIRAEIWNAFKRAAVTAVDWMNKILAVVGRKIAIPKLTLTPTIAPIEWWAFAKSAKLYQDAFWPWAEEWARQVIKQKEAVEEAKQAMIDLWKETEETAWKTVKWTDDMQKAFDDAFTEIDKDINTSKKSLEDYAKSIDDLQDKLDNLEISKDEDIASRVAEINEELAGTWDDRVSGSDRTDLENEKKEAFIWLTEEQIVVMKEAIAEQERYNALSEVWRILADYEQEKALLEQTLADKTLLMEQEQVLYDDLISAKAQMDIDYTKLFQDRVDEQKVALDWLIVKYLEVAAAAREALAAQNASSSWGWDSGSIPWLATWWPVSAGSPYIVGERWPEMFVPEWNGKIVPNHQLTVNQNVSANVWNDVDIDNLANELARKTVLAGKGIL